MNHISSARFNFPWFNMLSIMLLMILATLWGGCGMTRPLDGKRFQGFGADGTSVLGVVTYMLSRKDMAKGTAQGDTRIPPLYQELVSTGVSDQELIDGKVVVILYQWYQQNASDLHDELDWAIVEKGITVKESSVVEVQLHKPYAIVTRVLYKDIRYDGEKSGCKFIKVERGGLAALDSGNPVGGPATINLYCPNLEQEGWQKTRHGMYVGGFLMTKPPKP